MVRGGVRLPHRALGLCRTGDNSWQLLLRKANNSVLGVLTKRPLHFGGFHSHRRDPRESSRPDGSNACPSGGRCGGHDGIYASAKSPAGGLGGQGGGRPAAWTLRKSRGQVSGCQGRPRTLHLGLPQVGSVGRQGLACSQACVLIPAAELLCLRFLDTRLLVGPPNNNAFLQRLFLWLL